jgi:hypothetical protein
MSTIIIDGKSFSGNNITIRKGVVIIDDEPMDGKVHGVVEIRITEGILGKLECDASVICGEVRGNVSAGGSVTCTNVIGSVSAGGSVRATGRAGGTINAGGSVRVG